MRNTLGNTKEGQTLVYLYWEPVNADALDVYRRHRKEVVTFSEMVKGGDVRFVALSYNELWAFWRDTSTWKGMNMHLSNLGQRYDFSIQ